MKAKAHMSGRASPVRPQGATPGTAPRLSPAHGGADRKDRTRSESRSRARVSQWLRPRATSAKGLAIFTRQLATLVRAGMPVVRSLEVLARQEKRAAFRMKIEAVAHVVRSGGTLSDGLAAQRGIFDRLYVNMVRAGEAAGALDTVLERMALFMEKTLKITGRIRAAMVYPAVIVTVAFAIVAVLMVVVVPKFQDIFSGLLKGQPLPPLTRGLLGVSYFVRDHCTWLLVAAIATVFGAKLAGLTRCGRRVAHRAVLRVPYLGDLLLKAAVARFARTFGTLLSSGVPILHALVITRDTTKNVRLAAAIQSVHDRVKEGDTVARPLESTRVFPPMVTSLIEVGEETGALPAMLARIADSYDEEVDSAVTALTSIIEPLMIVIMAVVVGTIVVALFLPLVSIIQQL